LRSITDPLDDKEKRVYLNVYTTERVKLKHQRQRYRSNNPIWTYFLREENGTSALCQLCEDERIIKIGKSGYYNLQRHLKRAHDTVISEAQRNDEMEVGEVEQLPSG